MALFQDTMDSSRVAKPLRTEGNNNICAIYWQERDGSLNYGGTAPVPASLFNENNPRNKFIGFVPR